MQHKSPINVTHICRKVISNTLYSTNEAANATSGIVTIDNTVVNEKISEA